MKKHAKWTIRWDEVERRRRREVYYEEYFLRNILR